MTVIAILFYTHDSNRYTHDSNSLIHTSQQKLYAYTPMTAHMTAQPVPEKTRLEMLVGMQIEVLNGAEVLVN